MSKAEIKLLLALLTSQIAPADLNDAGFAVLGVERSASYQQIMDAAMDKLAEAISHANHGQSDAPSATA